MPTTTATRTRADTGVKRRTRRRNASSLGRYREDGTGALRLVVALPAAGGSTLVIDRLAGTKADARVVAVIAADEDPMNAQLVASMYVADDGRGRCRALTRADLGVGGMPTPAAEGGSASEPASDYGEAVVDDAGVRYRICEFDGGESGSARELRWGRRNARSEWEPVTLREAIAHFQIYEPFIPMTMAAVAANRDDQAVGASKLACELKRQQESPIVLNRGVREAVLRAVNDEHVSMSEIAARCGRKHSGENDTASGDTTWLQRRMGIKRETGSDAPTPWVHTEVLALIARKGLGIAPHEVEV